MAGQLTARQEQDLYASISLCFRYQSVWLTPNAPNTPSYRHQSLLDYLYNAGFTKTFQEFKNEAADLVRLISFKTARSC